MDFTFGIITDGNSDTLIIKTIESIHQEQIPNYEIIIVGNSNIKPNKCIKVIEFDETIKNKWITKKKNIICQEAQYENIVLMHDYLSLNTGWYKGFLEFGNTFDFCITPICNMQGLRFRDYIFYLPALKKYLNDKCYLPYDYIPPNNMKKFLYISGSYYIIKRKIALKFPLNEKLLHNLGEDVELSHRLSLNNIYITCNKYSSISLIKDKLDCFSNEIIDNSILKQLECLSVEEIEMASNEQRLSLNQHIHNSDPCIDYSIYTDYVESVCANNDLTNFKNNPSYTYMLEHVTAEQGHQYIMNIRKNTKITIKSVVSFCEMNDSFGNPFTVEYGIVTASPTSLRYIYHAHLILTHLKSLNLPSIDIVEVGGGYGGLCLAIHFFSEMYGLKINTYKIIDLPSISKLQKMYISILNTTLNIEFIDATTFGANITNNNLFLISNYCFSEISSDFQKSYVKSLFPKLSHGFMAWNFIPLYDFGFTCHVEDEEPITHPLNKYVYF
jgi:hypothetical protein